MEQTSTRKIIFMMTISTRRMVDLAQSKALITCLVIEYLHNNSREIIKEQNTNTHPQIMLIVTTKCSPSKM